MLDIGSSNPYADLAASRANADTSANPNETGKVLFDISLSIYRQASVAPESGVEATDDWNGRPSLNLKKSAKPLNGRRNHDHSSLERMEDTRLHARAKWLKIETCSRNKGIIAYILSFAKNNFWSEYLAGNCALF
ncbi:hypothetical protein [Pleomorphomonas sp. JP5]|uniref:hypothetical protein n=1 Tax=Pleomorphomonas sp. JP5 TaxID=2942998 RepID=UPI00204401B9|nr:hypothetical protein [Pleomorphomonas sp. JP5]MCM5556103.1 hypothetical protein [Pleomorphomonas sp. JP5]